MTSRLTLLSTLLLLLLVTPLFAASPLDQWQPDFDPSGASHTYLLSSVGHPSIEGVSVGFRIRDRVWRESNGRLYVDYRPLSQLGGEKDVLSKLKLGAVHGMLCSSVAATNLSPRLGIVNIPFLISSFEQLEAFRADNSLFEEYGAEAASRGIRVADFTGYGSYGWATTTPVTTLAEAANINFRIAQAPVNIETYKAWGLKFTVMPWPDVPQALQTGVITGLDHTPTVCNISRKFTVAKHFTRLGYAQGLYIHLINQRWLDRLPEDLRSILLTVIAEESRAARAATRDQENAEIARATVDGVTFHALPALDIATLKAKAAKTVNKWRFQIGETFYSKVERAMANIP